jgi:hypothetical protein
MSKEATGEGEGDRQKKKTCEHKKMVKNPAEGWGKTTSVIKPFFCTYTGRERRKARILCSVFVRIPTCSIALHGAGEAASQK